MAGYEDDCSVLRLRLLQPRTRSPHSVACRLLIVQGQNVRRTGGAAGAIP